MGEPMDGMTAGEAKRLSAWDGSERTIQKLEAQLAAVTKERDEAVELYRRRDQELEDFDYGEEYRQLEHAHDAATKRYQEAESALAASQAEVEKDNEAIEAYRKERDSGRKARAALSPPERATEGEG